MDMLLTHFRRLRKAQGVACIPQQASWKRYAPPLFDVRGTINRQRFVQASSCPKACPISAPPLTLLTLGPPPPGEEHKALVSILALEQLSVLTQL